MEDQVNQSISSLHKELRKKYNVFRSDKPLAIGVEKVLEAEGYDLDVVKAVLGRQTHTSTYKTNVKLGTHRFNLDGSIASEILPIHKEMARLAINYQISERGFREKIKTIPKNDLQAIKTTERNRDRKLEKLSKRIADMRAMPV